MLCLVIQPRPALRCPTVHADSFERKLTETIVISSTPRFEAIYIPEEASMADIVAAVSLNVSLTWYRYS